MRVVSLFSGIGGIDIAFRQAGHNIVWANDYDRCACMIYKHNFPDVPLVEADIRNIDKTIIPDCDIITAGFPCQPFSICGKQKGFDDKRGDAFFEICKIIDLKSPEIVFLENVANLTEHNRGKTFNTIHNELVSRGYFIRYLIADACDYGIPQHRTRTYLFAFRDKEQCDRYSFPEKVSLTERITDIIDTTIRVEDRYYYQPGTAKCEKLGNAITDNRQIYRFADWGIQASKDGIAFTLKANMGTYYDRVPIIKDDFGIRRITPKECLALQGFSKEFKVPISISDKDAYKHIGNAVCVPMVRQIVARITG
ncbi:MAG: DNA (cytosine-5-)-methyltransferase [Lachnospiraceae bacterium]|nr:DNA (cytosine-5-)-methyltransferase [Lachnospiraceae bacterium]